MSEQVVFDPELAKNPEPRLPCVLVLDKSGSMKGQRISELLAGVRTYHEDLKGDPIASKRVEICVISFGGGVAVEHDFATSTNFVPPELRAQGDTPMGQALMAAIERVEERKRAYRGNGTSYYRPWIFLITDGGPTDAWQAAAKAVHEGEAARRFSFFAVGTEDADMEKLAAISPPTRQPLKLKGTAFRELFTWLSNSQATLSREKVGTEVPLADPTGPRGWATVS